MIIFRNTLYFSVRFLRYYILITRKLFNCSDLLLLCNAQYVYIPCVHLLHLYAAPVNDPQCNFIYILLHCQILPCARKDWLMGQRAQVTFISKAKLFSILVRQLGYVLHSNIRDKESSLNKELKLVTLLLFWQYKNFNLQH